MRPKQKKPGAAAWNIQDNLCHNHLLAVFLKHRVQSVESTCCTGTTWSEFSWHHWGQCAPARGSQPTLWIAHPHWRLTATCGTGPFSLLSMVHSLGADMWAAVLSVHYEHSQGFVCGEEKGYLSKLWRKSPLLHVTVSGEILGRIGYCMCEHCHVLHCKWLMVANINTIRLALSYYLSFSFTDCCLPQEVRAHWWITCKTVICYQGSCTLVLSSIIFLMDCYLRSKVPYKDYVRNACRFVDWYYTFTRNRYKCNWNITY